MNTAGPDFRPFWPPFFSFCQLFQILSNDSLNGDDVHGSAPVSHVSGHVIGCKFLFDTGIGNNGSFDAQRWLPPGPSRRHFALPTATAPNDYCVGALSVFVSDGGCGMWHHHRVPPTDGSN